MLLAVPVQMQLLAAAWGFVTRSAAAATGSAILAAAWLAVALERIGTGSRPVRPGRSSACCWSRPPPRCSCPCSRRSSRVGSSRRSSSARPAAHFVVSGVAGLARSHGWTLAAGYYGFALAVLALYAALALELESVDQRPVLPTFRTGAARRALHRPFADQVASSEREPGVRQTL